METRGTEEPKFYNEEMSTGRLSRRLLLGFDRFYRRNVFKSGIGAYSWFHCLNKQCKSKVRAIYENIETVDEEDPQVEGRPTPHVLKESGLIHPQMLESG